MKTMRNIGVLFCVAALGAFFTSSTQADAWNKKTIVTINQSLRIPGTVLQPGKYVFKLVDSTSNRNIVRVMNEEENQVLATILSIPNYRLKRADKTEFGFWEMPKGTPVALRSWFYPGDNYGHEFPYPRKAAEEITAIVHEKVPAMSGEMEAKVSQASKSTDQPAVTQGKTQGQPKTKHPEVESTKSSQAQSDTTSTEKPKQITMAKALPKTASSWPLVGLIGLLSLAAGFIVRAVRQYVS